MKEYNKLMDSSIICNLRKSEIFIIKKELNTEGNLRKILSIMIINSIEFMKDWIKVHPPQFQMNYQPHKFLKHYHHKTFTLKEIILCPLLTKNLLKKVLISITIPKSINFLKISTPKRKQKISLMKMNPIFIIEINKNLKKIED